MFPFLKAIGTVISGGNISPGTSYIYNQKKEKIYYCSHSNQTPPLPMQWEDRARVQRTICCYWTSVILLPHSEMPGRSEAMCRHAWFDPTLLEWVWSLSSPSHQRHQSTEMLGARGTGHWMYTNHLENLGFSKTEGNFQSYQKTWRLHLTTSLFKVRTQRGAQETFMLNWFKSRRRWYQNPNPRVRAALWHPPPKQYTWIQGPWPQRQSAAPAAPADKPRYHIKKEHTSLCDNKDLGGIHVQKLVRAGVPSLSPPP